MMAQVLFDMGRFEEDLLESLNHHMTMAVAPMLEKALDEIEMKMRRVLAERLIALIRNDLKIKRLGNELTIVIKQAKIDKE